MGRARWCDEVGTTMTDEEIAHLGYSLGDFNPVEGPVRGSYYILRGVWSAARGRVVRVVNGVRIGLNVEHFMAGVGAARRGSMLGAPVSHLRASIGRYRQYRARTLKSD